MPSLASSSTTLPALGLFSSFSIFIASTTTRPWPSFTSSPTFTSTFTTLPGIGALMTCLPSAAKPAEPARSRSRRSSATSTRAHLPAHQHAHLVGVLLELHVVGGAVHQHGHRAVIQRERVHRVRACSLSVSL